MIDDVLMVAVIGVVALAIIVDVAAALAWITRRWR
jgi:hypothetical protein